MSQRTRVTDRRTDRILIATPRLHSMQRGKNEHVIILTIIVTIIIIICRVEKGSL